ncbi:MAG: Hydrolase [uncultured Thiotrichaceae bacterium]|uniref:Hydrolase n=1 Tax=uncultured Thiotrichaceae bacterium TaxID=298394 RepID=A0A6S6UDI6_9GAMM|nr:MAG: Hydrolase [uncultured Thiotrichaceae bacterium]
MANFNTHITVAAVASGLLSTLCFQVGFIGSSDALLLTLIGTIGGILPDVDLQHSYPSRIIFSLLGIIVAFLWMFSTKNQWSILELWIIGGAIYVLIRYPVWMVFHKYNKHRGAIHSLIAAISFALFATTISFTVFSKTEFISWLVGFLIFYGFIIHLLLDELYSVDFMNRRIKRSFGTAMKIIDTRQPGISGIIIAIGAISFWFSPSATTFFDTISSHETYQIIWHRMLPAELAKLIYEQ